MGSSPAPVKPPARRVTAPEPAPPGLPDAPLSPRGVLLQSRAGRLFLASAILKLLLAPFRAGDGAAPLVQILGVAATIGLILSVGYFLWRLALLARQRLLWRVRRKLIISYIFMGVVPAALIMGFFFVGALIVSMNVSAYMFKTGYDDVVSQVGLMAEAAASEIARAPQSVENTIARVHRIGGARYAGFKIAFIPAPGATPPTVLAGPWESPVPPITPAWIEPAGFLGSITLPPRAPGAEMGLGIRAVRRATAGARTLGTVIADVPVDAALLTLLYQATGVEGQTLTVVRPGAADAVPAVGGLVATSEAEDYSLFRHSVASFEARDWTTGEEWRASVGLNYRLGELYARLSDAQATDGPISQGSAFLLVLVFVAGLFLIIQLIALVMGWALARSITSSIHELFTGTERVRHGDFTHRIEITTKDQLGELAGSFNQMTASIEGLLQTAAEKKRLEEELRIARQIQMSLLPRGPLNFPGLDVTALCVPAREVGGDYYDFFPLPDERLGVLIADVSGKGTSAALYMAELKGLVLALSQTHGSPRSLLIEVNRIISEHLDSRSFITMTYAVIDLVRGVMTYCRAGHTPLIFRRGPAYANSAAEVLTPSGMVLGLRIPGAAEKFDDLLHEHSLDLTEGDVIVLYTDGISEAMNHDSDLFGDARLGRLIEEHGHLESGELRERILRELEAFVGTAEQHDDMTMILMRVDRAFAAQEPAVANA